MFAVTLFQMTMVPLVPMRPLVGAGTLGGDNVLSRELVQCCAAENAKLTEKKRNERAHTKAQRGMAGSSTVCSAVCSVHGQRHRDPQHGRLCGVARLHVWGGHQPWTSR